MDRLEFLRSVLGDEGYYCVAGFKDKEGNSDKKNKKDIRHKFYKSLEQAVQTADDFCENGYDAYFALSTFWEATSRSQANSNQMRALFVDVDYGSHHGANTHYDTFEEALTALRKFCAEVNLPKPYLVSSGGGLHGYWPLSEPVDKDIWKPVADRLKELCVEHDLFIDAGVSADSARILRMPGTKNYRDGLARDVVLKSATTKPHSIEFYQDLLGCGMIDFKGALGKSSDDDLQFNDFVKNRTNRFKTVMEKTIAGKGCEQVRYVLENRKTLSNPIWFMALTWAQSCVDKDKAIRMVSEGHPDYDPVLTKETAERTEGPMACAKAMSTMHEVGRSKVCKECPFWGKIHNPMLLGREVLEADAEVITSKREGSDDTEFTYPIPKIPKPYFRAKSRGIFKRVKQEDEFIDVEVYHHDLFVVRRMNDKEQGEVLILQLHLPHDGMREFPITMSAISTTDEFKKQLSAKGVIVSKADELRAYILAAVKDMQYQAKADIAHRQFGWTDDKCSAFVLGDKLIKLDQNRNPIIEYNPPTNITGHLFQTFEKKGDIAAWQAAMNFYNRPGMEVHQFIIGMSFGSIFAQFTAVNAGLVHIYSSDSGLGKTTALQAGAGIWGDPTKLVLKDSDTFNSKMLRAEVLKNLPLMLDEITNASAKELSDFVYPLTSGQQRNRMTTSSNGERIRGDIWKLLAVSTGNSSMIDKLRTYKTAPKGELMRILEIGVEKVKGLEKTETDKLALLLVNNYGQAAVPYLQYIIQNMRGVRQEFEKVQGIVDGKYGFTYQHRFYSAIITSAITGLIFARKAGLVDFKIRPIMNWLKEAMGTVHDQAEDIDDEMQWEQTLFRFWASNYNNVLSIKSTSDLRNKSSANDEIIVPNALPRNALTIRYEYDVKKLYIPPATLREWCVKHQISYSDFVRLLKASPAKAHFEKYSMNKGTRENMPQARVLVIDGSSWISSDNIPTQQLDDD